MKNRNRFRQESSGNGIYSICSEIEEPTFCFTGESHHATHKEIVGIIAQLGVVCQSIVSKKRLSV